MEVWVSSGVPDPSLQESVPYHQFPGPTIISSAEAKGIVK